MHWGYKIIVVFGAFILVMGILVYKSYHTRSELVTPEYYQDELKYEEVIQGSKNAGSLADSIGIIQSGNKFRLALPGGISDQDLSGDVWFYCAYRSANDLRCPLKTGQDHTIILPRELSPAKYTLKVNLNFSGKKYFLEKEVQINP